jgi:sulfate permease, SulP family
MAACRKRLTGIVAYMPQPVVAGYLGYVGYFCFAAGAAQATGLPIRSPASWVLLVTRHDAYSKEAATLAAYLAIFYAIKVVKTPRALPGVLLIIPAVWYAGLGLVCLVSGMPWSQLQEWLAEHQWVQPEQPSAHEPFWKVRKRPLRHGARHMHACGHEPASDADGRWPRVQVFGLFNLVPFSWSNIAWGAVLRQAPTAVAMLLVCCFGTPMDIMAVQAQVDFDIDSDYEVTTIGTANLAAGALAGGGTGAHACQRARMHADGYPAAHLKQV